MAEIDLEIPDAFHADPRIAPLLRPIIELTVSPEPPSAPGASAIGGVPLMYADEEWPRGEDGTPLVFLAQLNFGELPHLEGFPDAGLLQFFTGSDDLYGLDFDNPTSPTGMRVVYRPEVGADGAPLDRPLRTQLPYTDTELLDHPEVELLTPLEQPTRAFALSGRRSMTFASAEPIEAQRHGVPSTLVDWVIAHVPAQYFDDLELDDEGDRAIAYEIASALVNTDGTQIGGFPQFTQADPRDPDDGYRLLFQLDSAFTGDGEEQVAMWGDVGIGNFFITEADLAARDFGRVLYNWDCG